MPGPSARGAERRAKDRKALKRRNKLRYWAHSQLEEIDRLERLGLLSDHLADDLRLTFEACIDSAESMVPDPVDEEVDLG